MLELAAVMRASQAFSEEKDSYHLLSKLMSIIIEVAGAQRGCFVATRAAELYVEQIVEAESREQPLRGGIPLSQYENVCQNLISYVAIKRHFVISKLHVNNRVKAVTVAMQLNLLQATSFAE